MKPIKLTEQQAQRIAEAVLAELQESKLYNGKINVNYSMPSEDAEVRVGFAPMAFAKMMSLVYTFDSEVAWHGKSGELLHDGGQFLVSLRTKFACCLGFGLGHLDSLRSEIDSHNKYLLCF